MNWLALLGLDAWLARWRANLMEGAMAAEDRLTLARLEWLDQRVRLQQLLLLGAAVMALTVVVLIALTLAVLVQFWDTPHRALAAWLLVLGWALAWAGALWKCMRIAQAASQGFALTRRELAQDWQDLKERM